MDNHPIPQDITGFEFKLIGDMTIKQFAYLATGTILGWVAFSLPVPFLFRFPFMAIFITFGVSFAFFSIEGRPVDTMIINFLKAAFSPTQYIYQPASQESQMSNIKSQISNAALSPVTPQVFQAPRQENKLDKKEFDFFHMLSQMLSPSSSQAVAPDDTASKPYIITAHTPGEKKKEDPPPPPTEGHKIEVLVQQSQNIAKELEEAKEEEKKDVGLPTYNEAHQKVLELESLLSQTQTDKQKLEQEIMDLRRQLETQKKEVYTPSVVAAPRETKNVRVIPKEMGKSAGIPIAPEFPNVISGIIKDPRGNPLPNILVEVKDTEGNPVRAFKTNALGQFSASTALSNGSYTIEFEDPNSSNKFDTVAFKADGNIILPIEVISIDTREELRKSLFTN